MSDWAKLEDIIMSLTKKQMPKGELEYLKSAYEKCETMWEREVYKAPKVRMLMIGEAPLFGKKEAYIYSRKTPQSSFLYASDFPEGPIDNNKTAAQKKETLLSRMNSHGVVIIDAFPFALNNEDTPTLYYQNMPPKLYQNLLHLVFENYTINKINKFKKLNDNLSIAVRYSRTYKNLLPFLNESGHYDVFNLGKRGGGIDRVKFRDILCNHDLNMQKGNNYDRYN